MDFSSNANTKEKMIVRNAFLAGALSASLLWSFASWTLQSRLRTKSKSMSTSRKNDNDNDNDCNDEEVTDDNDNDYGFMIGEGEYLNVNSTHTSTHTSTSTPTQNRNLNHAQHHDIQTEISTELPSPPQASIIYNPWNTEGSESESIPVQQRQQHQQQQQHKQLQKQLLELRTSLIEHSRRTSLLLLDTILNQGPKTKTSTSRVDIDADVDVNGLIGELPTPKKRMRWPWESLRKHLVKEKEKGDDGVGNGEGNGNDTRSGNSGSAHAQESGGNGQSHPLHDSSSDGNENENESKEETKEICIGSIFGLDVGGTLSKLVYFEKKRDNDESRAGSGSGSQRKHVLNQHKHRRTSTSAATLDDDTLFEDGGGGLRQKSASSSFEDLINFHESCSEHDLKSTHFPLHTTPTHASSSSSSPGSELKDIKKMKRSHSLFDLSSKKAKREEALHRFYEFANNLDTYDTEVKDKALSLYSRALGGEVHFIQFETRYLPQAMDLIRINDLHLNISKMGATGGGAHKYSDKWEQMLGIEIVKQDELDSLVAGMQFIMADVVGECYTFLKNDDDSKKKKNPNKNPNSTVNHEHEHEVKENSNAGKTPKEKEAKSSKNETKNKSWSRKVKRDLVAKSDCYPYLLVMIGTGVSVIRVDGPRKHERISGSTIGGGTYWGLCRLLTDVEDFESVLDLAEKGDPSKVDM